MDQHDLEKSSIRSLADLLALALEDEGPVGQTLGEYQLLQKLGEGGMGAVYKARHTELDRLVALKVLRPGLLDPQEASARFSREIKTAGQLDHPHIVRALDARKIGQTHFLVMELVDGLDLQTLSDRLGPLPWPDACEIIRQAALGLQCAHEHGLIHRDIKPSNLMLSRGGTVKILDLGLARLSDATAAGHGVTTTGQVMGTPDYIAPEQVQDSRQADIRSDIYSLGCTLFKLLSGRAPFCGPEYGNLWTKLSAHRERPLPPLSQFRTDLPEGVAAVLARMTAKEPAERYAIPGEVAGAVAPFASASNLPTLLDRAEGGPIGIVRNQPVADTAATASTPSGSAAATLRSSAQRRPARRRWRVGLAALIVVLVAAAVWQLLDARRPSPDVPAAAVAPADLPGRIVVSWARAGFGRPHLWLIRPDGKEKICITRDPFSFDIQPKFSPDGRRIAFIRGAEAAAPKELWICNADGGDCRRLAAAEGKTERLASPVWVANNRIYYVRDPVLNRAPDLEVWQVDVDAARPEWVFRFRETLRIGRGLITDVSPDGRQLVVCAAENPDASANGIFVCDLQGRSVQTVWNSPEKSAGDSRALWSPDGRRIAWQHTFSPRDEKSAGNFGVGLAARGAGGAWTVQLQPDRASRVIPLAWSPDGAALLCARVHAPQRRITPATLFCMDPQFHPVRDLFDLDAAFWLSGRHDWGRLADWAVTPELPSKPSAPSNSSKKLSPSDQSDQSNSSHRSAPPTRQ